MKNELYKKRHMNSSRLMDKPNTRAEAAVLLHPNMPAWKAAQAILSQQKATEPSPSQHSFQPEYETAQSQERDLGELMRLILVIGIFIASDYLCNNREIILTREQMTKMYAVTLEKLFHDIHQIIESGGEVDWTLHEIIQYTLGKLQEELRFEYFHDAKGNHNEKVVRKGILEDLSTLGLSYGFSLYVTDLMLRLLYENNYHKPLLDLVRFLEVQSRSPKVITHYLPGQSITKGGARIIRPVARVPANPRSIEKSWRRRAQKVNQTKPPFIPAQNQAIDMDLRSPQVA